MGTELEGVPAEGTRHVVYGVAVSKAEVKYRDMGLAFRYELPVQVHHLLFRGCFRPLPDRLRAVPSVWEDF